MDKERMKSLLQQFVYAEVIAAIAEDRKEETMKIAFRKVADDKLERLVLELEKIESK